MGNLDRALDHLDRSNSGNNQRVAVPFFQFAEMAAEEPERYLRNIFQAFHDGVKNFVTEEPNEYPDDPESVGFVNYDCSRLFAEGLDNPFFADRLFASRLIRLVESLKQGSQQNKIYVFDGPPGCGKSTFLNNLLRRFEDYTNTEAGLRYEAVWRLDQHRLGDRQTHQPGPLLEKIHLLLGEAQQERMTAEPVETEYDPGALYPDQEQSFPADGYVKVPCPNHDHPILVIPRKLRRAFLEDLFTGSAFKNIALTSKEYNWLLRDEACTICQSIYQALLDRLGSHREVLAMLTVRPYLFNRRLGEGITVFNPGDASPKRFVLTNRTIQHHLNRLFGDSQPIQYIFSEQARSNNGIYALMDIKSHNINRLVELHNVVSEGVHKVENVEESITSLFLALMNPEDKQNIADLASFSDRVEYVNIPYVLDINTEVAIYLNIFGQSISQRFLPWVLQNFARVIISTRLSKESKTLTNWLKDPSHYARYCDENLLLLKMELYTGLIPPWLDEEDVKNFSARVRRKLLAESEQEGHEGLSGRDSIKIFSQFFQTFAKEDRLINMQTLINFFTKVRPDIAKTVPEGFLDALLSMYGYTVLEQIKESLYYFNEERIAKDLKNYLVALNYELGMTAVCQYTGEQLTISEEFLHGLEDNILGPEVSEERRHAFRTETQREYTSKTLTREMLVDGLPITATELYAALYERYVHNLQSRVLDPFVKNENFRRAIKDFGTEDFKTYERKIQDDVTFMLGNLSKKFNYTEKGAQEVCIDVIDQGLAQKFSSD